MKLSVIGAGTYGTAIANSLKHEHEILLYTRNAAVVNDINNNRKNTAYFNNKVLSKQIRATTDAQMAVNGADLLFLCLPSYLIVDFIQGLQIAPETIIVNGAKGFGCPGKLIPEALSDIVENEIISFKGPSFANEMIFEVPTAFTVAANKTDHFALLKNLFRKDLVVFDYSQNVRGVELLSVVKNVYAIILGVVDAMYNSANVRFLIFTKVFAEIKQLLHLLNIDTEVMFNYAGIGDLGLTSLNDLSRNRTLGLFIGKGFWGQQQGGSKVVLEGFNSLNNILDLIPNAHLDEFLLLKNLKLLLSGSVDTRQFVNNVILS